MKKIVLVLAVALVLSACPEYQSWPEPLLDMIEIEISGAEYTDAGGTDPTVTIELNAPIPLTRGGEAFDGIYSNYNRDGGFDMGLYLNTGIGIQSTSVGKDGSQNIDSIIVKLRAVRTEPFTLHFNTNRPMYFYKRRYELGSHYIIELKGTIKTPSFTVTGIP